VNLKGRNKITPEFSMSSMTDIVFLLLIFFMIASTLAKNLDTINIKLPQAKGKTENRNTVAVTINNSDQYFIDSKQVSKRNIESKLMERLKDLKTPSIVLRAEQKVPIDQVVFIMNLANKNGVKVVLAVDSQ
jgi:biopolymer transport protein ExbD